MSEPTDDDLSIAIRLSRKDLKRDIAEAEKDLTHFMERWQQEYGKAKVAQSKVRRADRKLLSPEQGKEAKKDMDVHLATAKVMERYIKTFQVIIPNLKRQLNVIKSINAQIKAGADNYKNTLAIVKSVEAGEKNLLKTMEKRIKQQRVAASKRKKEEAAANKTWFDTFKERFRLYTVMSSRGARMIATMRGAAGAALGAMAVVGQFALQNIQQGLQLLMQYESLAKQIAFTQAGQGGVTLTEAYAGIYEGLTTPGAMGISWAEAGIPRMEGAALELMRLKSDLDITDEQLIKIGQSAMFVGEESTTYFRNLINWMRMFRISTEDYDETIAMFSYMTGQVEGGSQAFQEGLDYLAGMTLEAGWDPRQFMVIQQEVEESGHDASKFMRGFARVLSQVVKDNQILDRSIRDANDALYSLDEVIWSLYDSYTRHEGFADSSAWALENFGTKGAEVISVLMTMIDEGHNFSTLMNQVNDSQEVANTTIQELDEIIDTSLSKTMVALNTSIEDFQMAIANLTVPVLKDFLDSLTKIIDWVSDLVGYVTEFGEDVPLAEAVVTGVRAQGPGIGGQEEKMEAQAGAAMGVTVAAMEFISWLQSVAKDVFNIKDEGDVGGEPEGGEDPGIPDCGEGMYWDVLTQSCQPIITELPSPQSPPVRRGRGAVGARINTRTSSESIVNHNYITLFDNDSLVRELLGANINV